MPINNRYTMLDTLVWTFTVQVRRTAFREDVTEERRLKLLHVMILCAIYLVLVIPYRKGACLDLA